MGVAYGDVFDLPEQIFDAAAVVVDSVFQLPAVSSARDVGGTGVDAGPFGGNAPYRLSGLPAIPRITNLTAPDFTTTTEGLTIELGIDSAPEAP